MDLLKTIIGALGTVAVIRGLFGVWNGWEDYTTGKKNENIQQMERGISGMSYGGMMAGGAAAVATAVVAALSALHF